MRKIPEDMKPGVVHASNNCGKFKVIEYRGSYDVEIEFIDTRFRTNAQSICVRNGSVKDPYHPSVFGVGYVGVGDYKPHINGCASKCYTVWYSMIRRCYSSVYHRAKPTYKDCNVCDEWKNFQVFAAWFHKNYKDGLHLDKDILIDGNKDYSPETCIFVTNDENAVKSHAKHYVFKSPSGEIVNVYNISEFCRKNGLLNQHMGKVHLGKRKSHKGWTKG